GLLNLETIGGTIIEAHFRLFRQMADLYGPGWIAAVVALYRDPRRQISGRGRPGGFSLGLFSPKGRRYPHRPASRVARVARMPGVSSVQITFHAERPPELHAMPPGGFRLAVINAFELEAGRAAREVLRQHFLGAEPAANVGRRG